MLTTTFTGCLVEVSDSDRSRIDDFMRVVESAKRFAYVRLCEGKTINETERLVKKTFSRLNGRWSKDAVANAKGTFTRAKQLVEEGELEDPRKIIWGGRKNLKRLQNGEITNEEWKSLRRRQLFSRGERFHKGNLNTRILKGEDGYYHLRISFGTRDWIYPKLWIPEKFRERLNRHLQGTPCYTIRVIRGDDDRYRVHVTFEKPTPELIATHDRGVIGIDLNPSGQAWVETNQRGQLIDKGWIETSVLQFASRGKRDHLIQTYAHQIADLALERRKGVVLEDLNFKRKKGQSFGRRINRIFNNFVHARLATAIERRCLERGVPVRFVNPAFTSVIGRLKYQKIYKHLVVHEAAALVIARRGMGFSDMPTGRLKQKALSTMEGWKSKKFHPWAFWRAATKKPKKRSAHSGKGKRSGTKRERNQGTTPTPYEGEIPSTYRVKSPLHEALYGDVPVVEEDQGTLLDTTQDIGVLRFVTL